MAAATAAKTRLDVADLEREFGKATGRARRLLVQKVLTVAEVSELQALFKQSTEGDGNSWRLLNDPKFFVKGQEQKGEMHAWASLRGMNPLDARQEYIDLIDRLALKYHVVFPPSRAGSAMSLATTYSYVR